MAGTVGNHPPVLGKCYVASRAFFGCNAIILKNKVSYEMPHEQHENCPQDCVVNVYLSRLASCSV